MWLIIKALLLKLKANLLWVGTAVIAAVVAFYRWRAKSAEEKVVVLKEEAEELHQQAAGYEAVIQQRKEAEEAVREVIQRQKTDPDIDLRKPW